MKSQNKSQNTKEDYTMTKQITFSSFLDTDKQEQTSSFSVRHIPGAHAQIGGGYAGGPVIIIDAVEIFPGEIEVMTLSNGDELETQITDNDMDAQRIFSEMLQRHAEPLQKAFAGAGLVPDGKYTIFFLNDFGFPSSQKITFHEMEFTTYAQHRDAINLIFTPYRKRKRYSQLFHDQSFIICEGWQDVDENSIKETLTDTPDVRIAKTKYPCFDSRYIEDAEKYLTNIIAVHKDYKTGTNGKLYA
jgi:hypothetical protein